MRTMREIAKHPVPGETFTGSGIKLRSCGHVAEAHLGQAQCVLCTSAWNKLRHSFRGSGIRLRLCGHVAEARKGHAQCVSCAKEIVHKGPGIKLRSCGHVGEAAKGHSACRDCHRKDSRERYTKKNLPKFSGPGIRLRKCGHVAEAQKGQAWCKLCSSQRAAARFVTFRERLLFSAKKWRDSNPEKRIVSNARRRALVNGAGGRGVSAIEWETCKLIWGGCAYCPSMGPLDMDHVVPLSRGGDHDITNVVPACDRCNSSKNKKLLSEWRRPARCYQHQVAA
jgi:5-methylcytosine-specific restriction endonuclease McrA